MRRLWSEEVVSFEGEHVTLDHVRCDPSPSKRAVPIHIGGASPAALRRTARFGDGYFPWVGPQHDFLTELRRIIDDVRAECERIGRDPDEVEYTVGGARTVDEAVTMAELGVDRCTIAIRAKDLNEVRDELARFGEDVIAPTHDVTRTGGAQ
jgi:alkanesulfonate monooxygenase SsuD/methylene tetrahydromethanopterin reductase-like flavin-dependent oxidoreductase (luciferase family)